MKFREKNDGGIELHLDIGERELLYNVKDIRETSEAFRRGAKGWEVIGNIHDNPELLKGE